MRRSHSRGVITNPRQQRCFCIDAAAMFTAHVGVCEKPEARPPVIMSDGTSRNFKRRRDLVSCAFQVRNHLSERQRFNPSNVLTNDPSGLALRNNAEHLRPEEAVISRAFALPGAGCAEWLARKPSANNIGESGAGLEFSHIVVAGDVRPVLCEHPSAEGIDLAEGDGSHSCALKAETESADAGKEVKDVHPFCRALYSSSASCLSTSGGAPLNAALRKA